MNSSKKDDKANIDEDLKAALPKLSEDLRRRILGYIEDYFKSKNEKIH